MQQKCHPRSYINFLIFKYLSFNWKIHARYQWEKNVIDESFYQILKPKYLKCLKYLKSEKKSEPSISNKMGQNVSDSGVGSYIFNFFSRLCTWLIYIFFLYVLIILLLRREEGVGIYCKLILDWTESTRAQLNKIYPSTNNISCPIESGIQEPNSKYYLEKNFNIS